jgi:hypothetical protein
LIKLLSLSVLAGIFTRVCCPDTTPIPNPDGPHTFTFTFSGLTGFAHDSNDHLWALMVDGRQPRTVNLGATSFTIPSHVPFVAFYPSSPMNPTPNFPPWMLEDEELVLTVDNPTSVHTEGAALAKIGGLDAILNTDVQVNPDVFGANAESLIVGRIKLDFGVLAAHRPVVIPPVRFKKMVDDTFSTFQLLDPNVDLTYTITARSISIERKSIGGASHGTIPLRDGNWRILVGNYPVGSHDLPRFETNKFLDPHFDWFYELLSPKPAAAERYIPLFSRVGPRPGSSPECMMGDF